MISTQDKPILSMSTKEIIKKLNLKQKIIDHHYNIEQCYHKVDDICSEELVDFVAEELYDYFQDEKIMDIYDDIAISIIDEMEEDLMETIYAMDDDARDYYNDRQSALEGRY